MKRDPKMEELFNVFVEEFKNLPTTKAGWRATDPSLFERLMQRAYPNQDIGLNDDALDFGSYILMRLMGECIIHLRDKLRIGEPDLNDPITAYLCKCLQEDSRHDILWETYHTLYAIGDEREPGCFGMWYGPTPYLDHMLNIDGKSEKSRIIKFVIEDISKEPTNEVIYRWNGNGWDASKGEDHGNDR